MDINRPKICCQILYKGIGIFIELSTPHPFLGRDKQCILPDRDWAGTTMTMYSSRVKLNTEHASSWGEGERCLRVPLAYTTLELISETTPNAIENSF